MRSSAAGFVLPFSAGTLIGVLGGLVLGAILGQRLQALTLQAVANLLHESEEPRFDLLAQ